MIRRSPILPIGQWTPDEGDINNNGAILVRNAIPLGSNYKPFKGLNEITESLPEPCIGAISFINNQGRITTIAGTASGLFELEIGGTWRNISRPGGYNTSAGNFWDFAIFNDQVCATNYDDEVQSYRPTIEGNFINMSSSAPRCRRLGIVNFFLVAVDTVDGDGARGNRIRWSPLGNPRGDWTSIQQQADFQDLIGDGSPAQAVVGTQDFGIIIRAQSIYRMDYVGPPQVFNIRPVEEKRGTKFPRSVVGDSNNIYFLGDDGFYKFDGQQSQPISAGRVADEFWEVVDRRFLNNMNAAIDPFNRMVAFSFADEEAEDGLPNRMFIYSERWDRWVDVDISAQTITAGLSPGLTLEEVGEIWEELEIIPFSLDFIAWKMGDLSFGAISSEGKLGFFNGDNLDLEVITTEAQLNERARSYIEGAIPLVDTNSYEMSVGYRDLLSQEVQWTPFTGPDEQTGEVPLDIEARYLRAHIRVTGNNWKKLKGFAVNFSGAGRL